MSVASPFVVLGIFAVVVLLAAVGGGIWALVAAVRAVEDALDDEGGELWGG